MHIKQTNKAFTRPNLLKEHVSQTQVLTEIKNNETPTHGIVDAGFRGMRAFVAHKKVGYNLIVYCFVILHDTIPSNIRRNPK